jgi:lipopolysaccharide export LptBFGC system permease protein LptF
LLDRYLLRELMVPMGFCLGGFMVFWLAFDLLAQVGSLQQRGLGIGDVAWYYCLEVPEMLSTVLPVGFLLALLYALTQHSRHNEITAIRAAGVGMWRLCLPYLGMGLLLVALLHVGAEWLAPDCRVLQERLLLGKDVVRDGVWRERIDVENAAERRVWNIGAFNEATGDMRRPRVRLWIGPGARQAWMARSVSWTNGSWRASGVTESLQRHQSDTRPPVAPRPASDFPSLGKAPGDLAWKGEPWTVWVPVPTWVTNAGVRTNLLVPTAQAWRTNLTATGSDGESWRASAMNPPGTWIGEARVERPAIAGAWRLVVGDEARWNGAAWVFTNVTEYLFRGAKDGEPLLATATSAELEDAAETPDLFRSELRINGLRRGRVLRRPELTLREINEYRRIHPVLPKDLAAALETQWHARWAAPWTCLVVVLIAVPFGVTPGRRNVFYGVAGSIGLAFIYFVLQRVGFAMGQSGEVPGWAAAWIPNAVFAVSGAWMTSRIR